VETEVGQTNKDDDSWDDESWDFDSLIVDAKGYVNPAQGWPCGLML